MTDGANLDPRDDARYRRGYQPGNDPESSGPADAPAGWPYGLDDRDDAHDRLESDNLDEFDDPDDEPAPGNPFLTALWYIGPGLFAAGLILIGVANSMSNSYTGEVEPFTMVFQQLAWALAPQLITAGLLTVLGLLFWKAHHWRNPED